MMNILLKQAVEQVVETMKNDYIRWSTQDGKKAMSEYSKEVVDNWNIEIKDGQKYIKLIKTDHKSSMQGGSVQGFIVKVPTKGFVEGDMLKAAGYNAPAMNFKRGNVYEDANNMNIISWTGIQ
jgi:hypothetical protein